MISLLEKWMSLNAINGLSYLYHCTIEHHLFLCYSIGNANGRDTQILHHIYIVEW